MRLHGYWRSGTSYRVRIALTLKGVAYEQVTHDLRRGEQRGADYVVLNPQGLVPALEVEGAVLTQSPAILEWIEERYPEPPLLPADLQDRALVRAMAAIVACDVHPLNNLRVLTALRGDLAADETTVARWIERWIADGFGALEVMVARHGRGCCFGATPTLADCHFLPQLYSAERFGVDLTTFPALVATGHHLRKLRGLAAAGPEMQPDADVR